ncbi:MAG: DUF2845 domain-containing protein [Halofilum sp. (in: g-proteobacteria)]|nr:DUF2845 domain-containing protein [Halofilum sp. (in: g-proteobacteria)]
MESRIVRLLIVVAGSFVLLSIAPRVEALRCGSDLVREGDLAYEVREACGGPDWVQSHRAGYGGGEEVWHYNFGPNDLIRIMHFRDGRLRLVRTAGRGFIEPKQPGSCRPGDIATDMSALELLQRCGRPVQRERGWVHYRLDRPGLRHPKHGRYQEVFVEDWYYDFGDNYLVRKLRLVDGIVVEIDTPD